jgi:hypothetical protein
MASVDIQPREGYLYAAVTGEYSLPQAQELYLHILRSALAHRVARVLIDCTRVAGAPLMSERRDFGIFQAEEHDRLRSRMDEELHIVILALPPFFDPSRYGESVAQNRGVKMKAVERLEDALLWLGVGEKPGTGSDFS